MYIDGFIIVLEKLADKYREGIEVANDCVSYESLYNRLESIGIVDGICCALLDYIEGPGFVVLKAELFKDNAAHSKKFYWHTPPFMLKTAEEVITEALEPRLRNIERTIARLQKELQTTH